MIGAAIRVHRELGPGFLESIYENALAHELRDRGISLRCQVPVLIRYRGHVVGRHRLDLLVEEQLVVELKTIHAFDVIHFVVVRSYLKATGCRHGLLLNFAPTTLKAKRVHRRGS